MLWSMTLKTLEHLVIYFFDPGELTALDRKQKGTAKADATRMLYNKLKFSGEMGFPIIPSVVGLYKVGNRIFTQGKNFIIQ